MFSAIFATGLRLADAYFCPTLYFYQRKNGLFKKAYELGVLCSVDVAVIIFGAFSPLSRLNDSLLSCIDPSFYLYRVEERPGHQVKLYQYCSGDIDEIVHRHSTVSVVLLFVYCVLTTIQFDGEKDTRTAADFAHNLNAKHDNLPEGDEDEVEDEGAEHVVKSDGMMKRAEDIGIKVEPGSHSGQFADIVDGLSIPNVSAFRFAGAFIIFWPNAGELYRSPRRDNAKYAPAHSNVNFWPTAITSRHAVRQNPKWRGQQKTTSRCQ